MSWISELQKTYENCESEVGIEYRNNRGNPFCLLPIAHTSQNAQIEIALDEKGGFRRARVVGKNEDQQTILPATEGAAGRSGSRVAPLSLGDKLQYVAGDYEKMGGTKKPGYTKYRGRLARWCESSHTLPSLRAILAYIDKGTVIQDLVDYKILFLDSASGQFPSKWSGDQDSKPEILSAMQGEQLDCLVRFSVEIPEEPESRLYRSRQVWESWRDYYLENKILEDNYDIENPKEHHSPAKKVFCYVSGDERNFAGNHPSKIRNAGDGAKLISSNDTSNFTYRGRFLDDEQACTIGYEVSQKAHNALRWLIEKQGYRDGDLAIIAWAPTGVPVPSPMDDTDTLTTFFAEDDGSTTGIEESILVDTAESVGHVLSKKIRGYSAKLGSTVGVNVMGLNSITPGRLSNSFYRELTGAEFLERVSDWHTQCSWMQQYSVDKTFCGAPSPVDIALAAFGTKMGKDSAINVNDKLKRATVQRLLPCIVDGMPIPRDIVVSVVRSATKRTIYKEWEWRKILGIACAVFRHHKKEERYKMAVERERKSRDYLFGRLLAVADCIESFALSKTEKGRATNAARYMQRFASHPVSTWRTIELALAPYKARLARTGGKYERALDEIMDNFAADDFTDTPPLTGEFLLGFHVQRAELMKKKDENESNPNQGDSDEPVKED